MYRDIIGKPEQIEVNGKWYWIQEFNRWDGTLKAINLYDEDGDIIGEFNDMDMLLDFVTGIEKLPTTEVC